MPPNRRPRLRKEEIAKAFAGEDGERWPPILSPEEFAELLRLSRSTIYFWIESGRLDGSFRRRGKHLLIWRDRAISMIFDGPEWKHEIDEE